MKPKIGHSNSVDKLSSTYRKQRLAEKNGSTENVLGVGATSFRPPSLLRRQTTRAKSFMDVDLPSLRALRREPSMMELDPPSTLFAPSPSPSDFSSSGPWAFFQAAEAQREQWQAQCEFLTKLQELRLRDEGLFVQLMMGFAKECPAQFRLLTTLMMQMEQEVEKGVRMMAPRHQESDWWHQVMASRENQGTKTSLMELVNLFGNPVKATYGHPSTMDRRRSGRSGIRDRSGKAKVGSTGQANSQALVPSLRRGKTFQQQQQAMQQLTAYQRQLFQQLPGSIPLAHEVMQYAAKIALTDNGPNKTPDNLVPLLMSTLSSSASSSSLSSMSSCSSPSTPLDTTTFEALMGPKWSSSPASIQMPVSFAQPHQLSSDTFQLSSINMTSSRRTRHRLPAVRT